MSTSDTQYLSRHKSRLEGGGCLSVAGFMLSLLVMIVSLWSTFNPKEVVGAGGYPTLLLLSVVLGILGLLGCVINLLMLMLSVRLPDRRLFLKLAKLGLVFNVISVAGPLVAFLLPGE